MPITQSVSGPIGEIRGGVTATGQALSTTPVFIPFPPGAQHLWLDPHTFSTAVVAQFLLNPWLTILKTTDDGATVTSYSDAAQDGSATTDIVLSAIGTAAQGDYLYVGSHLPFRGVSIDVDAANSDASVLTVKYWNGGAWVTIGATDGTDSAGASMGVDGTVTWTVPTAWAKASLESIAAKLIADGAAGITRPGAGVGGRGDALYWTRWEWSAALDAAVTLNSMLAMGRNTQYANLVTGRAFEILAMRGPGGFGCIEARTDAGTASLNVVFAAPDGAGLL